MISLLATTDFTPYFAMPARAGNTLAFAGFMTGITSIVLLRLAWTVAELLRQCWLDSRHSGDAAGSAG